MKIEKTHTLKDTKILVIATGSIAVVKTPLLISNLIKTGAKVRCVVTPSAAKLVSSISLATISRYRCFENHDQWDPKAARPLHIELSEWADFIIVAPLSASSLSRWVNGLGEGLAASLLLASEKPTIAAPAMNTGMWRNPAVQQNWNKLKNYQNVLSIDPSEGLLACDRIGDGRMSSPELIQLALESANIQLEHHSSITKDLEGLTLLVTAGPTIEDIDSARYFSNRSSGKMGVFLAQAARFRGAKVHLVHGPLQLKDELLEGLETYEVRSAEDMYSAINSLQSSVDIIAMAAAVADLKTKEKMSEKLNKVDLIDSLKDKFEIVPDLLQKLLSSKTEHQILLGFAALTGTDQEIQKLAISKLQKKGCDLLMANPIDRLDQGFNSDSNAGWLFDKEGSIRNMPLNSKLAISHQLLDALKNVFLTKITKK